MPETSLERIYPKEIHGSNIAGQDTLKFHTKRYNYAGINCINGTTVDVACGSGYGSFILAQEFLSSTSTIVAIDNSIEAIEYARKNYPHPRIDYQLADGYFYSPGTVISNVISLETIEHLESPGSFIHHWANQLQSGGRFIASVPVTPSMDANPYHLHDFTKKRFLKLFANAGLTEVSSIIQKQPYHPIQILKKKEGRNRDIRKNLFTYYLQYPSKFFLRLKSVLKDGFCNKYLIVVFEKRTVPENRD